MRNALILTGVWLGILVTAYAIVFWDQGIDRPLPISILEQQARSEKTQYIHPEGLFSLSVPMGWQVVRDAAYIEMADPNGSVTVWVMALDSGEVADSIQAGFALAHLGTGFQLSADAQLPETWSGEELFLAYSHEVEDLLVQVRVVRPERAAVMLIARGPSRALEALSANVDWIWSSVTIPADELKIL